MQTQKLTKKQNEMIMRSDNLYSLLTHNNGRMDFESVHSKFLNKDRDIEILIFVNEEDKVVVARVNPDCINNNWDKNNPLIKMYGKATCSEPDVFDIGKGIRIAINKLIIKIIRYIHTESKNLFRAIQYKFIIKSKMIDNDIEFVKYLISKY